MSSIPVLSSGEMTGAKLQNIAENSVPARLANRTIDQRRAIRPRLRSEGLAMTGSTTVIVFSVNNCWRESTTITKPTL